MKTITNNTTPSGFILTDGNGGMLKRSMNKIVFRLPMTQALQMVHLAQEVMDFQSAIAYVKSASKEHSLKLVLIYKERNTCPAFRKGLIFLKRRTVLS